MVDASVDLPDAMETAEISVSSATVALTEGGAAGTFDVTLTAAPGGSLDVTVVSADTGAVTVSPATLTFTDANYDTAQTVTVTPVDDDDAGDESVTLTLSATGLTDATVTATVTDDDTQAIVANMSSVTVVEEAASGATVSVQLAAQPTSDVTVTVASDDAAAASATPASLTFTSANWDTPQDVTIAGVADADTADESVTVTLSSTGLTSVDIDVTVTDDDTLNISATPGTINLTEDSGTNATLSVVLTQQPPGAVAVTLTNSDSGAVGLSGTTLNFDNTNWNTAQTVTVSAVSDNDAQNESVTITASATGLTSQTVTVSVTDDETQGIVLSSTTLGITEGTTGTINVTLAANPLSSVSVAVATSDAGAASLSTTTLTFDASNWNVNHPVVVTAEQDVDLANESVTLTMSSTGLTSQTVAVTVTDDDTQALVVAPTPNLPVTEGSSNNITVHLAFQPAGTVTVAAASANTGIATVTPASVTFDASNWNVDKTFMVAGVDDVDLVSESTTVTISSTGLTSVPVTVNVTDDDAQRIVVSPVNATLTEGGSNQNFSVSLAFDPGGPVTVNVSSSDSGAASVVTGPLSFDSSNFGMAQTTTIAPVDDPNTNDESLNITFSATGIANTVIPVTVNDDDDQALILSQTSLSVQEEGASASFTVRLAFDPVNPVTVTVSSSDAGAASVDLTSFTFNTGNYQTPRTINVAGVSDPDLVDEMVTITVSTAIAPSATVDVTVTEDDLQSLIVTHASPFEVTEDIGPRAFTVQLEYQPATTVGVNYSSDNTAAAGVSGSGLLLFTTTNYNVPQSVTVSGTTDANLHDTSANVSVSSPGLTGTTFGVTVFDDDEQDIIVLPSNSVTVDEESTFGVTIALAFEPYCEQASPGCTETVTLTSSDTDAVTASVASIGFTLANYTTPVPVTISGIDDADILNETETISLDSDEATTTDETIDVDVLDNDTQNFQFDPTSTTQLTEEDEPGTIGVRLTQDPVTDQTVTITTSDATTMTVRPNGGGGTGSSTTLTFTSGNYTTYQYVDIEAIADIDLLDEDVDVTFSTPTVATDVDRTIEVFDNDAQLIQLYAASSGGSPITDLDVDEGATSTFYVALAFQPSAPVTVDITESSSKISLDTSSIDFTGANFQTRVPVVVTGDEDSPEDLNDHLGVTVSLATVAVSPPEQASTSLSVDVFDTDIQEILVTYDPEDFPISIQEGGPTDNFFVALAYPPRDGVADVVEVDSPNPSELLVNGSDADSLGFTTGTWSIPQEVVVTALDDYDSPAPEADDQYDVALDIPTESYGPSGGDVVPVDVPVTVIDDEIAIIQDVTITSMDGGTRYTKRQNVNWFDTLVGVTGFDASSAGDVVLAVAPRDALGSIAPSVTVGNANGVSDPIQVIEYDGDNMGVFISDGTDGIVYARYSTDLASEVVAPTSVSGTDSIDFWPSFDGTKYGLVYRDATDNNLRFRTVQVDGTASGSTIITVPTASAHQHPNLHPRSGGGWVVFYTTSTAVRCVRLNSSGGAIGGSDVALPGLPAAAFVSSVANGDTGTIMLAYNDPTDGLSAAEVNPELCEVLAVRSINYNGGQLYNVPFIGYNGYEYKVAYDLIDGSMGVTTLNANGYLVDDLNVGTGSRPSIAWAGDRWVLRAQGSIVMQSGSFQTHCNDGEENFDETGLDCGGSDCVPCVLEFSFTSSGGDDIPFDALYDFMTEVQGVVGPGDAIQFAISNNSPLRGGGSPPYDGWCSDGNADWYVSTYIDMFLNPVGGTCVNAPSADMYNLCPGQSEWTPVGNFGAQSCYNGYWGGGNGSWIYSGGTTLGIDPGSTNQCELTDVSAGCSDGTWTLTLRIGAGGASTIDDVCTAGSGFSSSASCSW